MTQTAPKQNKAPTPPKNTGGLERVVMRNEFYRDGYRALVTATPVLAVALALSLGLNVWQATRPKQDNYFATDPAGRIIPIRALAEPYVTEPFLVSWVSERVARAYSMDPQNFRRQVADLANDFTPEGYTQYVNSLQESGTIEFITKNLLVSSAVPQGAPVVTERGVAGDVFYWKLQVPMLVQYQSALKSATKKRMVTVTVVRRQTLENPMGIGINQFVAADY